MKKLCLILGIIFLGNSFLFAQSITFIKNMDWNAVLAKATKENKLIFLDAYTSWCQPCKKMDKEIFAATKVIDFFNKNFINISIDMEKGEGFELRKNYRINNYPTLLFLNGNGEPVHGAVGFQDIDDFLKLGKNALIPDKQFFSLKKRYDAGERNNPQLVYLMAYACPSFPMLGADHKKMADEYLATQSDWKTKQNLQFIFDNTRLTDYSSYSYMTSHKSDFEKLVGKKRLYKKFDEIFENAMFIKLYKADDFKNAEEVDAFVNQYAAYDHARFSLKYRAFYYLFREKIPEFSKTIVAYLDKYSASETATDLNTYANACLEKVKDKSILKKALTWSAQAIDIDDNYTNNLTLAQLYFKLGNEKKAKEFALKAKDLAKATAENTDQVIELLKKL